jgi:hypothetical protein
MARDPFANYDSWLEQPYQDAYAEADRAEWIAENSTYETDCCGVDIPYDDISFDVKGNPMSLTCSACGEVAGVDVTEPSEDDDYDDDYDDFDPDLADDAADRYFDR